MNDNDHAKPQLCVGAGLCAHAAESESCLPADDRPRRDLARWLTTNDSLFLEMLDGCVVLDEQTRFLDANPAYCRMVGYSREELIAMAIADVEAIQSPEEIAERAARILTGGTCRFETRHRRRDGSLIDLDVVPHAVVGRQRGQRVIFCLFRDITDRKQAEERLRDARNSLEERVRERTESIERANHELRLEVAQRQRAEAAVRCQRDIALLLARAESIEQGLSECIVLLTRTQEIDAGGIYLVDDAGGATLAAHAGLSGTFVERVNHIHAESPHAKAVQRGQACYYSQSDSLAGPAESAILAAEGLRAVAAIPMYHLGRVVGCLNAASRTCDEFPEMVRQFLETVGSQIGAAVARLKSEEVLRLKDRAIAGSVSGIAIADASGRIRYANEACLNLWGFDDPSEILGRPIGDFWNHPAPGAGILQRISSRGGWTGELTALRRCGSTFRAQIAVSVVKNESGQVVAVMGSFLDVSKQRQAEEALRRSHIWYRSLIELGVSVYAVVDARGRIVYASPALQHLYGWKPGQVVGESMFRFIHPGDVERVREAFTQLIAVPRQTQSIELRMRNEAGTWRDIEVAAVNMLNEPAVEGVTITFHDITGRRQGEQRERLLVAAIDQSLHGLEIIEVGGRVVYANHAWAVMHGYRPEELIGMHFANLHPPDRMEEVEAARAQVWKTGSFRGELCNRRSDGSRFPALMQISLVRDAHGSPTHAVAACYDVTREKEAEQALLRAEKLRAEAEKHAAAGRMAARVAHEINNPLAGIANCFQLVKRAVPESHRHHGFCRVIETEIERIGRIVRQMHGLVRPGRGKRKKVHVGEAMSDVVMMLTPLCRQHEVAVVTEIAADLPLVTVAEDDLRQVLYNLIANAVEASPCGKRVEVEAAVVEETMRITVSDQGPGISLELHSRLFEPFFTTKEDKNSGGLGLGLPISKTLVESFGGSIEFRCPEGSGTSFSVTLPI